MIRHQRSRPPHAQTHQKYSCSRMPYRTRTVRRNPQKQQGRTAPDEADNEKGKKVYALVAPAFWGQFGEGATTGRLRAAFKAMGFQGMIEVAVFADILTLKEALEFDANISDRGDYQLTKTTGAYCSG